MQRRRVNTLFDADQFFYADQKWFDADQKKIMLILNFFDTDKKFFDDDQKLLGLILKVNRDYGGTEDFFVDIAVELVLERRSLLDRKVT